MRDTLSADELRLVAVLRSNAREKLTDISRKIKLPVSTIHEKLKKYSGDLIKRHTILVDFSQMGYPIKTHSLIKVDKLDKTAMLEALIRHRNVDGVSRINNSYDFLLDAYFSSLSESEEFFEKLEGEYKIKKIDTYYILDEMKREGFMMNLDHVPIQ